MLLRALLVSSFLALVFCPSPTVAASVDTYNLKDFGATGDGVTDDGPALQDALDALAGAGGGTLFVPQGRYAIVTPVSKDFSGVATSITITGVPSSTVVDYTGVGSELSKGLDLVSEFLPRTGTTQNAIQISGLQNLLITEIAFVGTPGVMTDAMVTLVFDRIEEAIIRHCEFYGLSSMVDGGGIITSIKSGLKIQQSKFLGCAGNSGLGTSVVQSFQWKAIEVTEALFIDYGQRKGLYGKLGYQAPYSWINIGNPGVVGSTSPRREAVIRNVFLDEGGFIGIISTPSRYQPPIVPIDLIYITGLRMNVSNLGTSGNYFSGTQAVLIENSRYQWSHNANAAINLLGVRTAILDELECVDHAYRIRADAATGTLSVINSVYTFLDSTAQTTNVINTAVEDDPVQYVRQQYENVLGSEPDPAGHFYWSNLLLRCGKDSQCITDTKTQLNAYLSNLPSPNFSITGHVTVGNGRALSDVVLKLSGSQAVTTQTDASGQYRFSNLPTAGDYTVTLSKPGYLFTPASKTFIKPSADQTADFTAQHGVPVLISRSRSTHALAFDSVLRTLEPFALSYNYPWSPDQRTRIVLFVANLELERDEGVEALSVDLEDASHRIYALKVENFVIIPECSGVSRVIVRLADDLGDVGDVLARITYRGASSNRVRIGIGHMGGGLADDPGSVPTPGPPFP